jgi:hypothetical protein
MANKPTANETERGEVGECPLCNGVGPAFVRCRHCDEDCMVYEPDFLSCRQLFYHDKEEEDGATEAFHPEEVRRRFKEAASFHGGAVCCHRA